MQTPYNNYKFRALTGEKADWRGFWITSPRFYHLPYVMKYGHEALPEFNSEITNIHTLFTKNFTTSGDVKKAKLFITGDDIYKLFVNGEFVGEGPAQSYPFSYNYNCYDVTDLIKNGENNIGVHLYYQGLFNIHLVSADNLCGLVAQLEITYDDDTTDTIISDRSWQCDECDAFPTRHFYGWQTSFAEDIDLAKWPEDWYGNVKGKVCVVATPYPGPYTLVPQITPPVKFEKVYPTEIKNIQNGYFIDFGKELTGSPIFSLKGKCGDIVVMRFGEELNNDGSVRYQIRANCNYNEIITLCGEQKTVEYFGYKGFRYMEILNAPEDFDVNELYVLQRNYPFPEKPAVFESSSELLNSIWKMCEHGVKIGTQDTYYDCPTRERGGFVGDALITGLSHLILTGDVRIYKKFIMDCINTSRHAPVIPCHLPVYHINFLVDYSFLIPLFLEEYYNYTGDAQFVKKALIVAEGIFEYFSQFLNNDKLLQNIRHMEKVPEIETILIDWPQNLRDDYDFEKAKKSVGTVINMFLYGFAKTTSKLYSIVGDQKRSKEYEALYTKVGESLIKYTYNSETKLFVDATDSTHSALHSNTLQMFFGLTPPDGFDNMAQLIREHRLNCGVYFAYFVLKGLYDNGYADLAYELLTSDEEHSWSNMLKEGATSCMEVWGKDQKKNTSWCHPWSSSPIYFIKGEIMGIKTENLGQKKVEINPHIPADIDHMHLDFPIPDGRIDARFVRTDKGIDYTVSAPDDIEITFIGENINFKRI